MAAAEIPSIFECAVCLNQMLDRTPRSLNCLHTFCEECLISLTNNNQILCPSCRQPTNVKDGSVKNLPVNFYLSQIKDFHLLNTSVSECKKKSDPLCEICIEKSVKYKCIDCPRRFCISCKKGHSKIKKYEGHAVYELCLNHEEVVQKLCRKCQSLLCKSCEAEHMHQGEELESYSKVSKDLKTDIEAMKLNISNAETRYDKHFETLMEKHTTHKQNLDELNLRRIYYADKLEEADKLIQETEENIGFFKGLEIEYEKNKFECDRLKITIETLEEDSSRFSNIQTLKEKSREMVDQLKTNLDQDIKLPTFTLCDHKPTKLAIPRTEKIRNLKSKALLATISVCNSSGYEKQIAALGEDIVVISKKKRVTRFNQKGQVMSYYYPKQDGEVVSVNTHEDKVYIVQKQRISVVLKHEQYSHMEYKPDSIESIGNILVMDTHKILISQQKNPGGIFCFDTVNKTTELVVQGLNCPTYINTTSINGKIQYIISDTNAHCVRIYSEAWQLLYNVGTPGTSGTLKMLKNPSGTAVTEQNTVLVADFNNSRISHFTLDGKFLSHLKLDGVTNPIGLLYMNSVLWVSVWHGGDIKGFQLQYKN